MSRKERPQTPDGRYLVARGLLKRCTNPDLDDQTRRKAVKQLMQGRMSGDKAAVMAAKTSLGEAGPVWWNDGAPDLSGTAPADTDYCEWWNGLSEDEQSAGNADSRLKK
ncbi:MAG: hypothetical protein AAF404_16370 [Pseudomonadota bacterium]